MESLTTGTLGSRLLYRNNKILSEKREACFGLMENREKKKETFTVLVTNPPP